VARLPGWQQRQSAIAARFVAAFADLDALEISPLFAGWEHGATCFPIVTRSAQSRNALASYLASQGIQTGEGRVLRLPEHCTEQHHARTGILETYDAVAPALLLLPCYAELGDDEVERVIAHVQTWHALGRCV
jgi:dTDP-4-amino-4,6-dideoxygalactose transaminase